MCAVKLLDQVLVRRNRVVCGLIQVCRLARNTPAPLPDAPANAAGAHRLDDLGRMFGRACLDEARRSCADELEEGKRSVERLLLWRHGCIELRDLTHPLARRHRVRQYTFDTLLRRHMDVRLNQAWRHHLPARGDGSPRLVAWPN